MGILVLENRRRRWFLIACPIIAFLMFVCQLLPENNGQELWNLILERQLGEGAQVDDYESDSLFLAFVELVDAMSSKRTRCKNLLARKAQLGEDARDLVSLRLGCHNEDQPVCFVVDLRGLGCLGVALVKDIPVEDGVELLTFLRGFTVVQRAQVARVTSLALKQLLLLRGVVLLEDLEEPVMEVDVALDDVEVVRKHDFEAFRGIVGDNLAGKLARKAGKLFASLPALEIQLAAHVRDDAARDE